MKKHKIKVLLIEDNPGDARLIQEMLSYSSRTEYELVCRESLNDGLATAEKEEDIVILLDLSLPDSDTEQTFQSITALSADYPVIVLTGNDDDEIALAAVKKGAQDYLIKGTIDSQLLIKSITYAIERHSIKNSLNETIKTKDRFFSIIAHDLRSPLMSLLGFSDMLKSDIETLDKDDIIKFANYMNTAAKGLFKLLDNLLNWAKAQTGNLIVKPIEFNLSNLLNSVITLYKPNFEQKKLILETSIDEDLRVYADHSMIETVARNLVSNAIKFTDHGGTITIAAFRHKRKILFQVKDTGMGMNEEMLSKLFQLDDSILREGTDDEPSTGLGLILCKEFIEKNDGTIEVESREGLGTLFTISVKPAEQ